MRPLLLAWSALALILAAGASAAGVDVTLNVGEYRNANGVRVLVFSGTVTGSAAGEIVDVVGQDCGVPGFRSISSTQTDAGGRWRVENPESSPPWRWTPWQSGITFRARWKDDLSAPQTYRLPAPLSALKIPGRRAWRVYTSPPPPGTVSMKRKFVELQRLRGGRWSTIRRARLAYKPRLESGAFNHEVVFAVPNRGWTLRAHLPATSAVPCYLAAATTQWRS